MRQFQKYQAQVAKGKVVSKDAIGKPKSIMDSAAEYLEITAQELIATTSGQIIIWEDVTEAQVEAQAKAQAAADEKKALEDKVKSLEAQMEPVAAKPAAIPQTKKPAARKRPAAKK